MAPLAEYRGKSGIGPIADFLMETDGAVGAVLRALDDHRLAKWSLVVSTSDNGHIAAEPVLQKICTKGGIYEGGHRVPFVVRWPGVTAAVAEIK